MILTNNTDNRIVNWTIVSGYTVGTAYKDEALALYESAMRFIIPIEIYPFKPMAEWQMNSNYKTFIIRAAFKRNPLKNIIWVDADARFLKYPALFDGYKYDIGVRFPEWPLGSGCHPCDTGTLFLRNTPDVRAFVEAWHNRTWETPTETQQHHLVPILAKFPQLTLDPDFPPEYCQVVAPDPVPASFAPYITKPGPIHDVRMDRIVIAHGWGSRTVYGK